MKVRELFETPYLNDEELPYKVLGKISAEALARSYTKFGAVDGLQIFKKNPAGFVAGKIIEDHLSTFISINCREVSYPVVPLNLDDNYQQISMVNVSTEFTNEGLAKKIYNFIARHIDLVSDHEQYLGAKGLWKSLARESDVNVYVFDGNHSDYVRDPDGKIVRYNSSNLDDKHIWGQTIDHKKVLLVATAKNL